MLAEWVAKVEMEVLQSIQHGRRETAEAINRQSEAVTATTERFAHLADQTEGLLQDAKTAAHTMNQRGEGELKRLTQAVQATLDLFGNQARTISKRLSEQAEQATANSQVLSKEAAALKIRALALPVVSAVVLCLLIFITLTLLRPGWTLTARQHQSLGIGEEVILLYHRSTPERQAEMRRLMEWKEPTAPGQAPQPRTELRK